MARLPKHYSAEPMALDNDSEEAVGGLSAARRYYEPTDRSFEVAIREGLEALRRLAAENAEKDSSHGFIPGDSTDATTTRE